ncbi:hypothetical protein B0A55_01967 [Friedmanniomyces simplex]|uniref:Peptidase S9 prolyl oligopeptidase catalytic domain-containing protein n=1 Tax=Friedmanniomyces simplex TaxID=329884 RepID=A0A4U0XIN0_9PEZI|nr:hypothetical protein B0A55_01967 [Friedmanniomyces simplex]
MHLLFGMLSLAQTTTTTAPPYSPTDAAIFQLSSVSQMAFFLLEVLSLAENGGSQAGEVLRIATQMVPSDFESGYTAFYPMAEAINALAESVDVRKDPVAAREAYFRAATHYRGADFLIIGNQSDPRHCIGIFYRAAACDDHRPTILIGSGYDGSQEEIYHSTCVEILKRGVNCVTYEGPGQPTTRREQNIGFIPEWWTTVTPIVDYLEGRPDVDMTRLALAGVSFGGILALVAASREPRFSALITLDGLVNLQTVFIESFGNPLIPLFLAGNVTGYNEAINYVRANSTYPSNLRWILDQSLWAFNVTDPFDAMTRLGYINVTAHMVHDTKIPTFVAKGQDDLSTINQPELLYGMMVDNRTNGAGLTTYHQFNTSLGAGEHCSLGAESQVWQVLMEWLSEDVWGGVAYSNGISPSSAEDSSLKLTCLPKANATVLFPSAASTTNAYEIVYGSRPRLSSSKDATSGCEDPPWQYAMLVRQSPSGDYTPLIRGVAWSTQAPWSMVLQGLLDATACAVHKQFGSLPMPAVEMGEELPRYHEGAGAGADLAVSGAESAARSNSGALNANGTGMAR